MSDTMLAYLLGVIFCFVTIILMAIKAVRKHDLSIVAGIIARLAFIYTGIIALTTNLTGAQELLFARVAVATIFFSDIVMHSIFLISTKYRETLEYKRLEKTLNDLQFKYKLTLDTAPIGFYVINEKGMIEYVNSSVLSLLGYSKNEVINTSVFTFIAESDRDLTSANMKLKFYGDKSIQSYTVNLIKKDGSLVEVKVFSNLTINGHPTITGCILTKEQCGE
jgi:PAS domain S-box-containing protein